MSGRRVAWAYATQGQSAKENTQCDAQNGQLRTDRSRDSEQGQSHRSDEIPGI